MTHFILIIAKHNFLLKWIVSVELFCLRDKGREITVKNVLPHLKNIIVLQAVHYSVCDFLLFLPPTARANCYFLPSLTGVSGEREVLMTFPSFFHFFEAGHGVIFYSATLTLCGGSVQGRLSSLVVRGLIQDYYHRQVSPFLPIFEYYQSQNRAEEMPLQLLLVQKK